MSLCHQIFEKTHLYVCVLYVGAYYVCRLCTKSKLSAMFKEKETNLFGALFVTLSAKK